MWSGIVEIETEIKFLVFIPITSYLFSIHLDGRKIPVFSAENVAETLITEIIGHVMAHRIGDYMSIKKKKKLIQKWTTTLIFILV